MDKNHVILIVSGHDKLLRTTSGMLRKSGFTVCTAISMKAALSMMASAEISLILSDLMLADLSGGHFLSHMKSDPIQKSVPFAFFVHPKNRGKLTAERARAMGADDYIHYPMARQAFVHRVNQLLPGGEKSLHHADRSDRPNGDPAHKADDSKGPDTAGRSVTLEKRRAQRIVAAPPIRVEVSHDKASWETGFILNHSDGGALIETALHRQPGSPIRLRCVLPEGARVVTGNVAHILLGEAKKFVGLGLNFSNDRGWPKILAYLRSERAGQDRAVSAGSDRKKSQAPVAGKTEADNSAGTMLPVPIDVTLDGFLWMGGKIVRCYPKSARIKTPILGKPGQMLRIRFNQPAHACIIESTIVAVDLDDMAPLAGMSIDFGSTAAWQRIYDDLRGASTAIPVHGSHGVKASGSAADTTVDAQAGRAGATDAWVETVFIQKDSPRTKLSTNTRFYHSLIGKKMDNYEVVSFISSGAMGGVFKGWDVALERDVALKVISFDLSSRQEFVTMFFKEARMVSKLNHQNIAQIYYIGNANDILYYAMEFILGHTLDELMGSNGRLEASRAVRYLETACGALEFVWKKQIIHRDIKPANIMVTHEDVVKIVDFGVARHHSKGTDDSKKSIVGSPRYLSPEAIRGNEVDFRSDIYSLGATFYHLIAGEPPFSDSSINGILQKHLVAPLPPLRSKAPETPQILCDVIEKMLAKDIDERFQDYKEIITILASIPVPAKADRR